MINRSNLPTFIGIGAPKTATTFLDQCLKKHPDIFLPFSKEPHFFSYLYDQGLDEYFKFFRGAELFSCRGEISASYFAHPEAPKRIRETIPDIKIILSVRNPADQIYSLYWQLKRHNFYQTRDNDVNISFAEALEKYQDVLFPSAQYGTHLMRWLEYFDRPNIHIIFYEDIRADAQAVLTEVYQFLGVASLPPSEQRQGSGEQQVLGGVVPRSACIAKIYGYLFVVLSKYCFMPIKGLLGYKNALWIKDKLKIRDLFGKIFFKPGYPPLPAEVRNSLLLKFQSEVIGLESLTGRDLSSWKFLKGEND